MTKHTATPWRIKTSTVINELTHNAMQVFSITSRGNADEYEFVHSVKIMDKDNWQTIAQHISEEDAAYIVKAVNAHETLVSALDAILTEYDRICLQRPLSFTELQLKNKIDAALKLAGEEVSNG